MDIARGKQYLRQIDSLAEKHWNRLEPRSNNNRQVSVGPLKEYTFLLNRSFQHHVEDSVSNRGKNRRRIHSEQVPKMSGRITTDRIQSERLGAQPDRGTHLFNQWGSNIDPLAEKVSLKKEDMNLAFQPFSFGDGNRKVQKPSPKKGVLMSRVSSEIKDRQIKTNTDFRSSRNGVVAVIHPVGPSPDTEVAPDVIDQQMIEREQTSVMLNRIDRMLHPNRYALKTKLAPSEEEVSNNSSKSSDISNHSMKRNIELDFSNGAHQTNLPQSKENRPKLLSNPAYAPRTSGKPIKSFSQMLDELDRTQINVDRKCRLWINKLTFDSYE